MLPQTLGAGGESSGKYENIDVERGDWHKLLPLTSVLGSLLSILQNS